MWQNPMCLFCITPSLLSSGAGPKPQEKMFFEKQAFVLIIKKGCGKLWLRGWTQTQNEVENSLAFNYVLMKPRQTGPWAQQLSRKTLSFFDFCLWNSLETTAPDTSSVSRLFLVEQWMSESSPGLKVRGVVKHFSKCITTSTCRNKVAKAAVTGISHNAFDSIINAAFLCCFGLSVSITRLIMSIIFWSKC